MKPLRNAVSMAIVALGTLSLLGAPSLAANDQFGASTVTLIQTAAHGHTGKMGEGLLQPGEIPSGGTAVMPEHEHKAKMSPGVSKPRLPEPSKRSAVAPRHQHTGKMSKGLLESGTVEQAGGPVEMTEHEHKGKM